jgi:hypothetical protein
VTLTVRAGAEDKPPDAVLAAVSERHRVRAPTRSPLRPATFLGRLVRRFGAESHPEAPPPAVTPPAPAAVEPTEVAGAPTSDVLTAALDSLGKAHHRPFSRS